MMDISLENEIRKIATDRYPNEMVGIIVGGKFIELENIANKPNEQYRLKPKDKVMLFELGNSLEALVHSHPSLNNTPSDLDLKSQASCGFPFLIIGTNGVECTGIREVFNEENT